VCDIGDAVLCAEDALVGSEFFDREDLELLRVVHRIIYKRGMSNSPILVYPILINVKRVGREGNIQ
jgi:hypothetical protein